MGILANENAISSGGYQISNSLRFQSASSQYLSRTFSNAATNNLKGTLSAWVKRGTLGAQVDIISCYNGSSSASTDLYFNSSNQLQFDFGNTAANSLITNAVYRDPSSWYHVFIAVDTTQATAANRVLMYVNGVQVTSFATANYPAQNTVLQIVSINANNRIGTNWNNSGVFFDGYLTEFNFIDGQALTPSSFGSTDPTSGQWVAAKYAGTYGTNGFYLPFSNGTSTTTLGADSSGNGNNWTLNNFTRSAGVSDCWMTDVPSGNSSTGGNYCVWNPLFVDSAKMNTISNGNLSAYNNSGSAGWQQARATMSIPNSGKFYWEWTLSQNVGPQSSELAIGPVTQAVFGNNNLESASTMVGLVITTQSNTIKSFQSGTLSSSYGTPTVGDVYGFAYDASAGTMAIYVNNVLKVTYTGITVEEKSIFQASYYFSGNYLVTPINFGQRSFAYTPPTGFKALCTANLPVATIKQGNKYMDATLYTGNGSTQTITNAGGFQSDLVWVKNRSSVGDNILTDIVRGANINLKSNTTTTDDGTAGFITALNSNGFSVGSQASVNTNTNALVGWQWKANGSASSNTNGSITTSVSAGTTQGFSIIGYTGTGANATIGHGLGVAPSMFIVKSRSVNGSNWLVYHKSLGNNKVLSLNTTNAVATDANLWQSTTPSSSVIYLGGDVWGNPSGATQICYAFAEIQGYSKFGSYTGNGATYPSGVFIYTGFTPRFLLIKMSGRAGTYWEMRDTARSPYNSSTVRLDANNSNAEESSNQIDIMSNGFVVTGSDAGINGNGDTYIYAAFASNPMAQSNAR